ncbi:MAG: hypothetical protein ACKO1U_08530 [Bacteroidota bacterium]
MKLAKDRKLQVDLDSVIFHGIMVPSARQCQEGAFRFEFIVDSLNGRSLFYKIYYQNESYKFNESNHGKQDTACLSNFYGSWDDPSIGFKPVLPGDGHVVDYFRIVGNPRNEKKYFGCSMTDYRISDEAVRNQVRIIRADAAWDESVKKKATLNGVSHEQQLISDAVYALSMDRDKGDQNHRWKRNPRMGRYSALLVVCDSAALKSFPQGVQDISAKTAGRYVNPYQYFLSGNGSRMQGVSVSRVENMITLYSAIDLSKGVFINKVNESADAHPDHFRQDCNDNEISFATAELEQYFTHKDPSASISSIPIIRDVLQNEYTITDYLDAQKRFSQTDLKPAISHSSDYPCETVRYDSTLAAMVISNRGNRNLESAVKENVGVKSRIGQTYGKFTGKIAFPAQLNATNVWSGITNAFWLVFQETDAWNNRRASKSGYAEKGVIKADAPRSTFTYYSEIDIELVKTSRYWPANEYFGGNGPVEDAKSNRDVIASVNNWDLADQDPTEYASGFCPVSFNGRELRPFRWKFYHQALSDRFAIDHEAIFSRPFYFFQIEWKPREIIWRMGPSKDSLTVIGYMNDAVTNIPDNQMCMVVSQEFHPSSWWVPIPFRQEYIPFPAKEISGKIYELTVE